MALCRRSLVEAVTPSAERSRMTRRTRACFHRPPDRSDTVEHVVGRMCKGNGHADARGCPATARVSQPRRVDRVRQLAALTTATSTSVMRALDDRVQAAGSPGGGR